jgi:hypothetical protein
MRYLVIDASLNGTGIRDKYEGGYISAKGLGLSPEIVDRLNNWLSKYESEHYNGFEDERIIDELDREGKEIASVIKSELPEVKLEYFSDARLITETV